MVLCACLSAMAQTERFCIAREGKTASIIVDADDWIHPQCFEILIRMIKAAESKLAISELDHTDKYRSSEPIDIEKVAWRPIEFEELFWIKRLTYF